MRGLVPNRLSATALVLSMACFCAAEANAANVSEAHDNQNGKLLFGILVEGDIEPGDAIRLQNAVLQFDMTYSPHVARFVYLRF